MYFHLGAITRCDRLAPIPHTPSLTVACTRCTRNRRGYLKASSALSGTLDIRSRTATG